MSEKKKRNISILVILAFVFTLEYIAQSAWIFYLQVNGNAQVEKCLKIDDDSKKTECFTQYIENRNHHAILGVNGYLITIIAFFGISVWEMHQARKNRKAERENGRDKHQ